MKFTEETYNLICELLEAEANNNDDPSYRKEIEQALKEVDTVGTL